MTYNIQEFCSSVRPLCHPVTPLKPVNMFQRIFWGLISYSPILFIFYSNDFRGVPYQTMDLLFLLYERFESGIKYHKTNLYERLGINYLRHIWNKWMDLNDAFHEFFKIFNSIGHLIFNFLIQKIFGVTHVQTISVAVGTYDSNNSTQILERRMGGAGSICD